MAWRCICKYGFYYVFIVVLGFSRLVVAVYVCRHNAGGIETTEILPGFPAGHETVTFQIPVFVFVFVFVRHSNIPCVILRQLKCIL